MSHRTTAARNVDPSVAPDSAPPHPEPVPPPRPPLVKSEDWVAAWLGLAIIALVLLGVRPEIPKFKWATDSAVAAAVAEKKGSVEALAADAAARGEPQLAAAASALRTAAESGDRPTIGKAARDLGEAAKSAKDASLKKKATELGKGLGDAGAFLGGVFSACATGDMGNA